MLDINRPTARTPHETTTTQNKNLIKRERKIITFHFSASCVDTRRYKVQVKASSINAEEFPKRTMPGNSRWHAVRRVYAR
jgi:hypothetical protein